MAIHSRRTFLTGLGAAALAAPFVSLLARPARAQATPRTKRLVVFFTPNGVVHQHWRPVGTERDFAFGTGSILEPLAAHRERLVVLDELDFVGADNHEGGMRAMLTGGGGADSPSHGASVDQFIASRLGTARRFRSLELGVQTSSWGASTQTRMSYAAAGEFMSPEDDPVRAFQRMFGDVAGGADALDRTRRLRKSVLDLARTELTDLSRRLGAEERLKLDAHLSSLRDVETSLVTPSGGTCATPSSPDGVAVYGNDLFPVLARNQVELAVQALACGLTDVVSVQLSHTVGDRIYSWLDITEGQHSLSHADDSQTDRVRDFARTERWNAEQFGHLLTRLAETADPEGGSLLDSTLVLWAKEMGDSRMHVCKSVPWVLAGGGAWATGRYLRLGGAPHTRVLVSMCRALGLDVDAFGDPAAGTGALGVL